MKDPVLLLQKYLINDSELYKLVLDHSKDVAVRSLTISENHPELKADNVFLEQASMLHDIGVFMTNAPGLHCFGRFPYICHGYLGREILEKEGLHYHGLVCERHTGTGISLEEIVARSLQLPLRDMMPLSIEEKIICFADLFYSKSAPGKEKAVAEVRRSLEKFGEAGLKRFDEWCLLFL